MHNITDYIEPQLISFLDTETREETLSALVDLLEESGKLNDKEQFHKAVIDRENIVSTGIGMGVAIPHAKLSTYDDFFIAIGVLKKGVDWDALDHAPVRLVFLIGGPDDKQTEYLQILSSLTQALKDEERRKKMLNLASSDEILKVFGVETN